MAPLVITIQTFADTLCPWSYIGNVTMDRAMAAFQAQHPEVEFELSWNPFYLFPDAKVSAYDKVDLFTRKFGAARAQDFFARVDAEGKILGLALSFDGLVGNTRDSHALLLLAQRRSQTALRELQTALYRGTFEQGRDISDRVFLLEAARQVGLCGGEENGERGDEVEVEEEEEEVRRWLDGEEARGLADGMNRRARMDGIVAVPSFVVQGRYRVGGKQEARVFLELFERILRTEAPGLGMGKGRTDDVVLVKDE